MSLTNRDLWIDPSETDKESTQLFGHLLIAALVIILCVGIIWADFAVLDEITRGEGKVIPSSQTQMIQSERGGRIVELPVREGDIVEAGQRVVVLDNSTIRTNVAELEQRVWTGMAAVARLEVEQSGGKLEDIKFPDELLEKAPQYARAEEITFKIRAQQQESQKETLRNTIETRKQEIRQIDAQIASANSSLAIARERLAIVKPMVDQGVSPQIELLEAQQDVQQYQSELTNAKASRPAAEAALAEANSKLKEVAATFESEASTELSRQRKDLESARALLTAEQEGNRNQALTSPVRGTVKQIMKHSLSEVVQPAEDIMEIVPIEDSLLIEAQIRPQDRGFIAPNQPAKIKITAYDYSIYGGLDAKVEQISADAIENEKKELYFRVRLRTDKNFLMAKDGSELQIIPGMTATVDILTGKKTVLDYLLKPILKASEIALTER